MTKLRYISVIFKFMIISLATLNTESKTNPCGHLYLTQSPYEQKYLEFNWDFSCNTKPDTILLTKGDPLQNSEEVQILYKIFPGNIDRGYHKTNISSQNFTFPGNWTQDDDNPDINAKCFDHYIASVKNDVVIYSQCLSIAPAWMADFGELRIAELVIPGTHNSGAWRGPPPVISDLVLNQDKNFWQQLVFGIRYFDIRIGRYGEPPDGLYINHSFMKCTQLIPELLSVVNFVKKSPKEIITLNFHRFPIPSNFTNEYHQELVNVIKELFQDLIIPYPKIIDEQGPKLNELWQSEGRVIISYNNEEIIKENDWMWPSVQRYWGDIAEVDDLENYIKEKTSTSVPGNPMAVLMAELTPKWPKNLKDLAVLVNKDLAYWIRNNDNLSMIIATDFFTGNDIINVALDTNFKKIKYL